MTLLRLHAVVLVAAMLCAFCSADEPLILKGKVVGPDDKPIANARIALIWKIKPGSVGPEFEPVDPSISEADGAFTRKWPGSADTSCVLIARDSSGRLGTLTRVSGVEKPVTLRLVPLSEVHLEIECAIPLKDIYMSISGENSVPLWHLNGFQRGTFHLPPGTYFADILSPVARYKPAQRFEVREGEPLDLGQWTLEAAPFALVGSEAPELSGFSSIRGLPQDFTLEKQRGKWVAIEFWSYG